MTTCIYYDGERFTADDVRRARALAGSGVNEITRTDTIWAAEIDGPPPQRVLDSRNQAYLADLMPHVIAWTEHLETAAARIACRHGVSLADVARYDFLFSAAAPVQRWLALAQLRGRFGADRVVWVTAQPDDDLFSLVQVAAPLRVDLLALDRRKSGPAALWQQLKLKLSPSVNRVRAASRVKSRLSQTWPEEVDVVVTEHFYNSVSASLSVADHLQQAGLRVCWVATRSQVADALTARGVASLLLPDLLSLSETLLPPLGRRQRQGLASAWRRLPNELFRLTDEPGERNYLVPVLERRIIAAWSGAAYWTEAYHQILYRLRPRAVLSTTYSSLVGRASALVAQQLGGRAIYLQHGLLPRCSAYSYFPQDVLLVWGPNDVRNLSDFGVAKQSIHVTGPTIYDGLAARATQPQPRGDRPLRIAYMASRTGGAMVSYSQAKLCLLAVAQAARSLGDASLVVKTHPGDHTGMVPEVMREFPEFSVVTSGKSQDIIIESDVVIVVSSTTGLEACVADRPLLVLDVFDDATAVPYAAYGAAVRVPALQGNLAAEVGRVLKELRSDSQLAHSLSEGRQKLREDMLGGMAGDAVRQAARVVLQSLDGGPGSAAHSLSAAAKIGSPLS